MRTTTNTVKKLFAGFCLLAACFFSSCEVGLGPRVNTERPVISIPDEGVSQPGSFLAGGSNIIYLNVEQEFGLQTVYMTYWWFTEVDGVRQRHERTVPAQLDDDGRYFVDIDADEIPDGTIYAQVTAVDVSGNTTTTTEMIYTIKNTPPEVELTLPPVSGIQFDMSDLNSRHMAGHPIMEGGSITGLASDLMGIAAGYPQIMIWPSDYNGPFDSDTFDINTDMRLKSYNREWGQWRTMVDNRWESLDEDGLKAVQIRWPLYEFLNDNGNYRLPTRENDLRTPLPVGTYFFKIRVMDKAGVLNIYPHRINNSNKVKSEDNLIQHMEIAVVSTANPIVTFVTPFPPLYYNGKEPFKAKVSISSQNPVNTVLVYLDDFENGIVEHLLGRFGDGSDIIHRSGNDHSADYDITIPWPFPTNNCERCAAGHCLNGGLPLSGEKTLKIEAIDLENNNGTASVGFLMDLDNPNINFLEPLQLGKTIQPYPNLPPSEDGLRVTSTVFIRGTTSDPTSRVETMYYTLGKTETAVANSDPYNLASWKQVPFRSGHVHDAGGFHIDSLWEGSVASWSLRLEDVSDIVAGAIPGSGNYYVNDYNGASNLWLLPMKFKLVDRAGNTSIHSAEIIIDPAMDLPVININSHTSRQVVGGAVRVSGMAIDNEWIHDINVRVTIQGDADCGTTAEPNVPFTAGFVPVDRVGNLSAAVNWFYEINADGKLDPPAGTTRVVKLEFQARDASMYKNTTPKNMVEATLYLVFDLSVPVIDEKQIITVAYNDPNRLTVVGEDLITGVSTVRESVIVRARVSDDSGVTSIKLRRTGETLWAEYIDTNTPNANTPWVEMPPVRRNGGTITSGRKYWIKETATGLDTFQEASLRTSGKDTTFIATRTGTWTGTGELVEANYGSGNAQRFQYTVFIPLNTNVAASSYYNSAGIHEIGIQVVDNTNPNPFITIESNRLQVDNFYPIARFTGNVNAVGDYLAEGEAWDSRPGLNIGDVSHVVVYFTRGGTLISLNEATGGTATATSQRVKTSRSSNPPDHPTDPFGNVVGETATVLANFPNVRSGTVWATNTSGIVINDTKQDPGGYQMFSTVGGHKYWSVNFDSTRLRPGPVTLNYVVFDNIGNATHYSRDIYIANNRPIITRVSIGTDINLNGSIDNPSEYVNLPPVNDANLSIDTLMGYPEKATTFRVRNNRFNMKLNVAGGNNARTYRISHVNRSASAASTALVKGEVYTIANDAGNINWINYGVFGRPAGTNCNGVTFVATAALASTGASTVYTYSQVGNWTSTVTNKSGNLVIDTPMAQYFDSASFGTAANQIHDSKTGENPNRILNYESRFLIKVWDTTVASAAEMEQLAHAVVVKVGIDNVDDISPRVSVDPFFWVSETNNSIYQNSRSNGHIELEGYLPASFTAGGTGVNDRDPKVSGIVSFRGQAVDTHTIGALYFRVNNHANASTAHTAAGTTHAATRSDIAGNTGVTYYRAASYLNGAWNVVDRTAANGWKLTIEPGSDPEVDSHTVHWRLDFDSSFVNNNAHLDNIFTIVAVDSAGNVSLTRNPNSWAAAYQTTNAAKTEHYRFDAVPYISEVVTELSSAFITDPSVMNRSALGGYPVREDEVIGIKGFNLSGGSTIVRLNNTDLDDVGERETGSGKSYIVTNVGESAVSGDLEVTVNGITSLNNRNNNARPYNSEPNGINNNILNDNRRLYVWNTGHLVNERVLQSPFMRMADMGNRNVAWRYMSYGHISGGAGRLFIRVNNNLRSNTGGAGNNHAAGTQIEQWVNMYNYTTVAVDEAGSWYALSANRTAVNNPHFTFYARVQSDTNNGALGDYKRRLLRLNSAAGVWDFDRVKVPRLFVQNTNGTIVGTNAMSTRAYISYYVNGISGNPVLFHHGTVGTNTADEGAMFGGNIQAEVDGFGRHASSQVVADNNSLHKGGEYTAVGALSNGLPVIAWYDRLNQNLVFSHGGSSNAPPLNNVPLATAHRGIATNASSTARATEFVYTAENHSFGNGGITNAFRYLVSSGSTESVRYVRRTNGDKFMLNTSNAAGGTNTHGENVGNAPITLLPHGFTTTANGNAAGSNVSNPPNAGTTLYRYWTAAGHGLEVNDRVRIVRADGTTIEAGEFYVVAVFAAAGAAHTNSGNMLKFASKLREDAGASDMYNPGAVQINVYPITRRGVPVNTVTSTNTRAEETYYTFSAANYDLLSVGNDAVISSNTYRVEDKWASGTNNIKFATVAEVDGEEELTVVNLGTAVTVNVSGGNVLTNQTGTNATSIWQNNAVIVARSTGAHVDMAVDRDDNVHLAYYDVRNGGLHYAFIPSISGGTVMAEPDTRSSAIQVARVDTYLTPGVRLMINVRREGSRDVPYISYYHNSFTETKNAIRIAWMLPDSGGNMTVRHGTDESNRFTGAWEVMTVPVGEMPLTSEFICHGVPTSSTWVLPGSGSALHYNSNMHQTVLLGYMTTNWYEGAILKDNIRENSWWNK